MSVAGFVGAAGFAPASGAATTLTLSRWSSGYLAYIGAASGANVLTRAQFLERWADYEGTFNLGNEHNPLDTELDARGAHLYNEVGVRSYPTLLGGFAATLKTMQQSFDRPILTELRSPHATWHSLAVALAESNWTGFGQRSWPEQFYASRVASVPIGTLGLPQPTATLSGVVTDPLGRRLAGLCVAAFAGGTRASSLTSGAGTFQFARLPRAAYRVQVTDCHGVDHHAAGAYFAAAGARHSTGALRTASTVGTSCVPTKGCPDETISLPTIRFGTVTPRLVVAPSKEVSFGQRLGAAGMRVKTSVAGTISYRPALASVLGVGHHQVTVTLRPLDRTDFTPVTTTITMAVARATPTVVWHDPAPLAAGTPISPAQLDASASVPGTFTYSVADGAVLGASQRVAVRFTPANLHDYRAVVATAAITVAD